VVYLRKLYYPGGFSFPLETMPGDLLALEIVREACTLAMLVVIAWLAGKNRWQRFAWFIYTFAIWDMLYYVGLKIFLNWPASPFTWDILFLIPLPWLAPVLAPVVCSLTMILMAVMIVRIEERGTQFHVSRRELVLVIGGAVIIMISFMKDFIGIFVREGFFARLFSATQDPRFQQIMADYVPGTYDWPLFIIGEAFILSAIFINYKYLKRLDNA
jgi:hypothetical protein